MSHHPDYQIRAKPGQKTAHAFPLWNHRTSLCGVEFQEGEAGETDRVTCKTCLKEIQKLSSKPAVEPDKMSVHWPPAYLGRIPVKVRMACDLGPDMWGIIGRGTPRHWVKNKDELPVKVNQNGAMSVVTPYGDLGVKPLECEIIEWRAPNL